MQEEVEGQPFQPQRQQQSQYVRATPLFFSADDLRGSRMALRRPSIRPPPASSSKGLYFVSGKEHQLDKTHLKAVPKNTAESASKKLKKPSPRPPQRLGRQISGPFFKFRSVFFLSPPPLSDFLRLPQRHNYYFFFFFLPERVNNAAGERAASIFPASAASEAVRRPLPLYERSTLPPPDLRL